MDHDELLEIAVDAARPARDLSLDGRKVFWFYKEDALAFTYTDSEESRQKLEAAGWKLGLVFRFGYPINPMEGNAKKLKRCPICGRSVEIHGGPEEWEPTFDDPDSGGDPYCIDCPCGLHFEIDEYDDSERLARAWNDRYDPVDASEIDNVGIQEAHPDGESEKETDSYFCQVRFCDGDIISALLENGIQSTDENLKIVKKELSGHWFTDELAAHGNDMIKDIIWPLFHISEKRIQENEKQGD